MPGNFTLKDHAGLNGPMGSLFTELRSRILAVGPNVSMSVLKGYIAFVHTYHFVDVLPRKRSLRVLLNVPFQMLNDPESRCEDIGGTFGPFEAEFSLTESADLGYCMNLVRQAYERGAT